MSRSCARCSTNNPIPITARRVFGTTVCSIPRTRAMCSGFALRSARWSHPSHARGRSIVCRNLPLSLLFSPRPIGSVLIANRGEIALRVMRTCARLGIRTIAVYSDADAEALHVKLADEAVRIGPPAPRASYLDIGAVIAAAKQSGADAVHPGYGFLSENAGFVRACEAAGLIFIGPSLVAVEQMGSKIESKRIAETAGVPTVPGYHGDAQDDATLAKAAAKIGFPVLIKASAGGGGRGMRRVDHASDFVAELNAAKAEAEAAFGDNAVLLEKYILNPRHLEVQLAG